MKPWENNIRKIKPYTPGEQPGVKDIVKLNTNENPFPPAPGVMKALKGMDPDSLRRYPDPSIRLLTAELARFYKLEEDMVFAGVGSDDVLAMAFLAFFNSDKPILFPDISYSFYPVWCDLFHIPYETPPLDENFKINRKDYYKENGGVVIANPNAPTGICEDLSFIEDILSHNKDCIVIIDEAYIDFSGKDSAVGLIHKYDNLIVVQTFSKARSMAGMRIGYAMGNPVLIKALNDVKYSINSYTMNSTAIIAGVEAVRDAEYCRNAIEKIIKERARSEEQFKQLGFTFTESGSNFLFVTHRTLPASEIFNALRENNIYVRYFNAPRIDNYLRVSIGKPEDMDKLFAFLKEYIESRNA